MTSRRRKTNHDKSAAHEFGRILAELRKRGGPMQHIDRWKSTKQSSAIDDNMTPTVKQRVIHFRDE